MPCGRNTHANHRPICSGSAIRRAGLFAAYPQRSRALDTLNGDIAVHWRDTVHACPLGSQRRLGILDFTGRMLRRSRVRMLFLEETHPREGNHNQNVRNREDAFKRYPDSAGWHMTKQTPTLKLFPEAIGIGGFQSKTRQQPLLKNG